MIEDINHCIPGRHGRDIVLDLILPTEGQNRPLVLFCHGYKGFKDWGAWNLMARTMVAMGVGVLKFNFSHNGGTCANPIDFPDLEAFGQNTYSIELDDLEDVVQWVRHRLKTNPVIDSDRLHLVGHSRGGGIVCIYASEHNDVRSVVSLAGVSDYEQRFGIGTEAFDEWGRTGIKYVVNGRTGQMMPHLFSFYEDFEANKDRLCIKRAVERLGHRQLIIHGDNDTSVSIEEGKAMHLWNPESTLEIITDANHVFNTYHPWDKPELSPALKQALNLCMQFIINQHSS